MTIFSRCSSRIPLLKHKNKIKWLFPENVQNMHLRQYMTQLSQYIILCKIKFGLWNQIGLIRPHFKP